LKFSRHLFFGEKLKIRQHFFFPPHLFSPMPPVPDIGDGAVRVAVVEGVHDIPALVHAAGLVLPVPHGAAVPTAPPTADDEFVDAQTARQVAASEVIANQVPSIQAYTAEARDPTTVNMLNEISGFAPAPTVLAPDESRIRDAILLAAVTPGAANVSNMPGDAASGATTTTRIEAIPSLHAGGGADAPSADDPDYVGPVSPGSDIASSEIVSPPGSPSALQAAAAAAAAAAAPPAPAPTVAGAAGPAASTSAVIGGIPGVLPFAPKEPDTRHHLFWGSTALRRVLGMGPTLSRIARGPFNLNKWTEVKDLLVMTGPDSATVATVANVVNSIIGAGVLAFPSTFLDQGVVFGPLLIALMAIVLCSTMRMYTMVADDHHVATIEGTVDAIFGPRSWMGGTVDILVSIGNLFTLIAYFVIMRQGLRAAFVFFGVPGADTVHNAMFVVGLTIFAILPLGLVRNLNSLAFTSVLGMCIMISLAITMVARVKELSGEPDWTADDVIYFNVNERLFRTLPILCMALGGHVSWFPIRAEMKDPSYPRAKRVMTAGYAIATVMYTAVGAGGYLSFLGKTKSNIIENYSGSTIGIMMTLAVVLNIIFTFPLILRPITLSLDSVLFRRGLVYVLTCRTMPPAEWREAQIAAVHERGPGRRQIFSVAIILVAGTVGSFIDDLGLVVAISGSLSQAFVTILLPGLMWVRSPSILRRRAALISAVQTASTAADMQTHAVSMVNPAQHGSSFSSTTTDNDDGASSDASGMDTDSDDGGGPVHGGGDGARSSATLLADAPEPTAATGSTARNRHHRWSFSRRHRRNHHDSRAKRRQQKHFLILRSLAGKAAKEVMNTWSGIVNPNEGHSDEFTKPFSYFLRGYTMIVLGTIIAVAGITTTLATA
jgi:amino acid permease